MDAFPRNVRALIKDRDLTQQEFAQSIGLSITSVNGWLKRGVQPQRHNLDAICGAYGVSHNDLLSDTDGLYARLNGLQSAPAGATRADAVGSRFVPVRVLGAAHAGEPDQAWELDGEAMLYETLAERHPRCYALRVNGDCMDRCFTDKDCIFVDPDGEALDGSIVWLQ